MRRISLLFFASVGPWLASVQPAFAQTSQNISGGIKDQYQINLIFFFLVFFAAWFMYLAWVYTADWANRDAVQLKLNYTTWNPAMVLPFLIAAVVWSLPFMLRQSSVPAWWVMVGPGILLIALVAPLIGYVTHRNARVEDEDAKVWTKPHLRRWFSGRAALFGVKVKKELPDASELGPPIKFTARGGATEQDNQANQLRAKHSQGYLPARELLADALSFAADGIMLDYTQDAVSIRYQIDGVWHQREPRDRESGDPLLEVLKTLAGRNPADRRGKQEGVFGAEYSREKYNVRVTTQGVPTGERALVNIDAVKARFSSLDELGMRPKMQEELKAAVNEKQGFVLLSALPGNGLTTTTEVLLRSVDRFIRDYAAIEDVHKREREVENIAITTYDSAAGESPATVIPKLARTYPGAYVVRDPVNAETISLLCKQVSEERMVVTSVKAKEAVEALLRVLMLKVPAQEFAPVVHAVLNQRLVRKLCESCKEAYPASPDILRQLGVPAGRVEVLYREPPPPEEPENICTVCNGIGYHGRTAIFEYLAVNEQVREALIKSPKVDVLRTAARKAGMRTLQEEGVVLAVKGVTSVAELARVLKQ